MQKFTVFTVILTILVVVVSAETFVNKYLPSFSKADITSPGSMDKLTLPKELPIETETKVADTTKILEDTQSTTSNSSLLGIGDIQKESTPTPVIGSDIEGFSPAPSSVSKSYLSDSLITNSGFTGASIEAEVYDNTLYKNIDLADLKGIKVEKYNVTDNTNSFAKVYVISFDGTTTLEDTYNVIKLRAGQLSDVQLNETNEFGLGSFYMNDVRRSGVAFLTVKIADKIYGFSYPKQYHPQIKNLVSLLLVDF